MSDLCEALILDRDTDTYRRCTIRSKYTVTDTDKVSHQVCGHHLRTHDEGRNPDEFIGPDWEDEGDEVEDDDTDTDEVTLNGTVTPLAGEGLLRIAVEEGEEDEDTVATLKSLANVLRAMEAHSLQPSSVDGLEAAVHALTTSYAVGIPLHRLTDQLALVEAEAIRADETEVLAVVHRLRRSI